MLIYQYSGTFHSAESVNAHAHRGIELVLVTRGECSSSYGGKRYCGRPGTLFVVSPETLHNQENRGEVETFYTVFSADEGVFSSMNRIIDTAAEPLAADWMRTMFELYHRMANDECRCLLQALLLRLNRLEKREDRDQNMGPVLAGAVRFIETRFSSAISQEVIAAHVGVSVSRLKTLFRDYFQVPPMTYVNRRRMSYAQQMLADRYLSIGEAAERAGFDDPNYFARSFRRCYGISPSEFRGGTGPAPETGAPLNLKRVRKVH